MRPTLRNDRGHRGGRLNGRPGEPRTAIIQSGGGAKGAYSIGVMRAVLSGASASTGYRPIDPEIYTGTSVGAYNAAIMTSQPGVPPLRTLEALEQIWRQQIANTPGSCGSGVFRLRGLPIQELAPACFLQPVSSFTRFSLDWVYLANQMMIRLGRFATSDLPLPGRLLDTPDISAFFDPQPMRELVWSTVDLDGLRRSSKALAVATSSWQDGFTRVFTKQDIVEHQELDAILASTAIPGIFPPVEIHGVPYVDGALTMNTPLRPAIRAGADVLHVIYLDPLVENSQPPRYPSTFETTTRVFAILAADQIRNDIRKAQRINEGLAILRGATVGGDTGEMIRRLPIAAEVLRRMRSDPRRQLIIHRYLPPASLASGTDVLNFDIDHIDALIEQGYRDAVQHDCRVADCLLPAMDDDRRDVSRQQRLRPDERERIGLL